MVKNNLKEIRMKEYLKNKREFAKMLGISEPQYNRYENGVNQPPLETALLIAEKLGKSCDEIWRAVSNLE